MSIPIGIRGQELNNFTKIKVSALPKGMRYLLDRFCLCPELCWVGEQNEPLQKRTFEKTHLKKSKN